MLLYKSIVDNNEVFIGDRKSGPAKRVSPRIAYEFEKEYQADKAYIPIIDKKRQVTLLRAIDNPAIRTVGINFVANLRGTEIVKGYCNLEVFKQHYTSTKNVFKVLGNFDMEKLSINVPIASLIVRNLEQRAVELGPYSVISFYIVNYAGEEKIKVETKPYDYQEMKESSSNKLVKLLFYNKGKRPIYLIPSQVIISDFQKPEEVCEFIGRLPNEKLLASIHLLRNFDLISSVKRQEKDLITICKNHTREEIINLFDEYGLLLK